MTLLSFWDHYSVRKNRAQSSYGRGVMRLHGYQDSNWSGGDGKQYDVKRLKRLQSKKWKFFWKCILLTSSKCWVPRILPVWWAGPCLASPSPLPGDCCIQILLFFSQPSIPSSLYTTICHISQKWKSDSVISLLKVIQRLFLTWKIRDSHIVKRTYQDLGDAASFASWAISFFPFLPLRCGLAAAWNHYP